MTSIVQRARHLEEAFLGGLEDAQNAYEEIVATQAWQTLGYDTFAEWWQDRVVPAMRALSMRPTKEIAASVVEQVREEEAALPPAQRRTQRELAEMAGVERSSLANRDGSRSVPREDSHRTDLEPPVTREWDGNRIVEKTTADPLPADVAEQIEARIEDLISPEARERNGREREEQQFKELHSRELAKCVWLLAERARRVDAVEFEVSRWQPSQDVYPAPTTPKRLQAAGEYLIALSERWPE